MKPFRATIRLALVAVPCSALAAGCLSVRWSAQERYVAIPEKTTTGYLEPGVTTLQACLDRFGAPLFVYEQPDGAFAIAYGWYDQRELGGQVSYPVIDFVSASIDYRDSDAKLFGFVLFFQPGGELERWRRGYLREILPTERRRPATIEHASSDATDAATGDERSDEEP